MNINKNQYYQDDFFSYELVKEIMAEFEWPKPYELIDEDFAVEVAFPKCTFEITSDGEGGATLTFLTYNHEKNLNFGTAIALEVRNLNAGTLELEERNDVWPNINDTKKSIRNIMKLLQVYFLPFINGEKVDWLEKAKKWDIS